MHFVHIYILDCFYKAFHECRQSRVESVNLRQCIELGTTHSNFEQSCSILRYPVYSAENGSFRKLGWTYRHGTVFAPRQYVYQMEVTGMESPEKYSTSQCTNSTYLRRPVNYPV